MELGLATQEESYLIASIQAMGNKPCIKSGQHTLVLAQDKAAANTTTYGDQSRLDEHYRLLEAAIIAPGNKW